MSIVYGFTTLDDAQWFLNQAKGLPEIASAKSRRERYVRACVVLSWIALEESLDIAIKILHRQSTLTDDVPLAIIAITGTWSFLFWLQLRLSFNYARNHSEYAAGFFSTIAAIIGFFLFVAVEILILDALLIQTPEELSSRWFFIPTGLWALGGIVVIFASWIQASHE